MKDNFKLLAFLTFIVEELCYFLPSGSTGKSFKRIAYGSCYNGFLMQRMDMFKSIIEVDPEMFVWLGDATYVDDFAMHIITGSQFPLNKTEAELRFKSSFEDEHYSKLRQTKPIIGIWDDHDYGSNNGDKNYEFKEVTKQIYLDFLEVPLDSSLRKVGNGLSTSYSFGEGHESYKILLPDLRFELTASEMMSEETWKWLENELQSNETFLFIGSSVQFLPINRLNYFESWIVSERQKLIELIHKTKRSGVIILSGDVHFAEIMKTPCIHPKLGYHLYEYTSSGLSHYDYWVSIVVENLLPDDYKLSFINTYNYGLIEFDWGTSQNDSSVTIGIRDIENNVRWQNKLKYQDLIFNQNYHDNHECEADFNSQFQSLGVYLRRFQEKPMGFIIIVVVILSLITIIRFLVSCVRFALSLAIYILTSIAMLTQAKQKVKNN